MTEHRRRFKQIQNPETRLAAEAHRFREGAKELKPEGARGEMLRKARQCETSAHQRMASLARAAAGKVRGHGRHESQRAENAREAEYAERIARSATDAQKRELYERLAAHFRQLASEIEEVTVSRSDPQ